MKCKYEKNDCSVVLRVFSKQSIPYIKKLNSTEAIKILVHLGLIKNKKKVNNVAKETKKAILLQNIQGRP